MKKIFLSLLIVLVLLTTVVFIKAGSLKSLQPVKKESQEALPEVDLQVAEKLSKAIQIRSISYDEPEKFDSKEFLKLLDFLKDNFPLAAQKLRREVINEYSLLYTWEGTDKSAAALPGLFMAHLDVVPIEVGTEKDWKYQPYEGRIAEGYIWGRGAIDDKVNVIGFLEAAEKLLAAGFNPKRTLYFAFGHDEEISGINGAAKIAEHLAKQNVKLDFVLDEGLFILDGMLPGIDKPVALIGAAEKGYLDIELTVKSPGGHSSQPPAETAVGILSKAITAVEENKFPAKLDGAVEEMFKFAAPEMSGALKIIFANRWLFSPVIISQLKASGTTNALIRTTAAPTMLNGSQKANVMPQAAKAVINFRILPDDSVQNVVAKVKSDIADERVEIKVLSADEPVGLSDLSSASFKNLQESIASVFPEAVVVPSLMIGGTDSKRFAGLTKNIYRFSPMHLSEEDLAGFHGTNEKLGVENLKKIVQFYMYFFKTL